MKLIRVVMFIACLGGMIVSQSVALQPPAAATPDKVTYRDVKADGKITTETVETKESPKGVELIVGGKSKGVIDSNQIIKLEPSALGTLAMPEVLTARSMEDGKDPGKAATAYSDLLKKAGPAATDKTKRYLGMREAAMLTKLADSKTGADFVTEAKRAADKWNALVGVSRKSWEIWPVSRNLARLQAELNDFPKAAAALNGLAGTPDLPKDLKYEAQILAVVMEMRAKNTLSSEGTTTSLDQAKDLPTGALRDRVNVLKVAVKITLPATAPGTPPDAATINGLKTAIDTAKDPTAKAIGYMTLGEVYLAYNQPRDAMWAYLWVDVVHNAEKDYQILAVRRLEQIFEALGDKERAEQYRDKATRVRS
jgi:hypothetical protein